MNCFQSTQEAGALGQDLDKQEATASSYMMLVAAWMLQWQWVLSELKNTWLAFTSGTDRRVVTNVKCPLKTTGSLASLPTCLLKKSWLAHLECDRQKVRLITFRVCFWESLPFPNVFFFAPFPRWMCEMYPTDLGAIPSGVSGYTFGRHKKKKFRCNMVFQSIIQEFCSVKESTDTIQTVTWAIFDLLSQYLSVLFGTL